MLSREDNERLTRVGRGTPMGELMRRYWQPIAAVGQLDEHPTKPVRVMGEDLVLYRDARGCYGLLDRHCAHRRADLCYGMVEDRGLRCHYHGWLFDRSGRCLEQPFEEVARAEARFKDKIALAAYPVEAKAGLLWAYLGPPPAPLVPDWDLYHERGYKQIVFAEIPCNWFQGQENSIDPIHFEWLHGNWSATRAGQDRPRVPAHRKIGFTEFDWGFVYRRVREDTTEEDELWTVGRVCLWPNCLYTGKFEWRVPIDDERTLHVAWFNDPLPGSDPFEQPRIPYWHGPVTDPVTGRWITSHVMNQDFVAWAGQGAIADRTKEHLGESDRGVILFRKRMLEEAAVVARGGEPKAVIRDAEKNVKIVLPRIRQGRGAPMGATPDRPRPMLWHAGQPREITEEIERLWDELGGPAGRSRFLRCEDAGATEVAAMVSQIVSELRATTDAVWARLRAQLHGMESYMERSDAPGEWTTRQVLCHLLFEPGWRPGPVLFSFATADPPVIEIKPGQMHVTPERQMMSLRQFENALDRHRREALVYLETLGDEDLQRKARIPLLNQLLGTDEVTMPTWFRVLFAIHWSDHADQLAKIRKAVGLPEAPPPYGGGHERPA